MNSPRWNPRHPLRRTTIALCVATLVHGAQAVEKNETEPASVVVLGQSAQMRRALDVQQDADAIVSVVHADDIGSLPDANAAEALQRVPGVSIERDQGEGRYVRVRGLGPDLNSVTINGSLVPAPEAGSRAVMLDVIPSSLVRSLQVQKTLTPDQDANSIGGTVEVRTISAFDFPGRFLALDAEAGLDGNTGQGSPKLGASWADRFLGGTLGLAAGLSWEKRRFGSDNVETGGAWSFDEAGQARLDSFEKRDYRITRERLGGVFNADWKPVKGQLYYLRTMASRFSDDEERQAQVVSFSSALAEGESGSGTVTRKLKQRSETQTIQSLTLGTEQKFEQWKIEASAALSRASEDTPDYISSADFAGLAKFSELSYSGTELPELSGPSSLYDAASYSLKKLKLASSATSDRVRNLRFDASHLDKFGNWGQAKTRFGFKFSRRTKENDENAWSFSSLNKAPASLSPAQLAMSNFVDGEIDWRFGRLGPRVSPDAVRALLATLDRSSYFDEEASRVNDYSIREDISAGYLQSTWSRSDTHVLAGVRYERTRVRSEGTGVRDGEYALASSSRSYGNWLPALHLRQDFGERTSLRAALTHSVVRPNFEQIAPGYSIDGTEASFGNPELKPWRSRNLDLGLEHRFGDASVVSAYVFHKHIRDFIYATDVAGSGKWSDFDEAATFANGGGANVRGLELAYSQDFKRLAWPWNGVVIGANTTFSKSSARIERFDGTSLVGRDISLPSQSDVTANLMLGYEYGPVSLRVAANYKSDYLLEVGNVADARLDKRVDDQTQIDLSARYALSPKLQLVFELQNLTDEPYSVYTGERSRNAQYEQYGRSYKLGLKFALH